jgi:PEP-CTERM motif
MKKLSLPGASIRLLALFALTAPILAGTITDPNLSISSSTNTSTPNSTAPEASKIAPAIIPGRTDNSNTMPSGTRAYTSNGDIKTYAFGTTADFLNAANLMNDEAVSLSSVNFGRIPFQQLLIVSPGGNGNNSSPLSQIPEPASLILIGTGLAALGIGMKKRKTNKFSDKVKK